MKKGIITFILGISLLLGSKIINPDIAYAYDKTNYQYSNGYYYVDNTDKHSTDNHITLNVLIEKDSILEGKFLYDFKCISNNFTDSESYDNYGYNLMRYENKKEGISIIQIEKGKTKYIQSAYKNHMTSNRFFNEIREHKQAPLLNIKNNKYPYNPDKYDYLYCFSDITGTRFYDLNNKFLKVPVYFQISEDDFDNSDDFYDCKDKLERQNRSLIESDYAIHIDADTYGVYIEGYIYLNEEQYSEYLYINEGQYHEHCQNYIITNTKNYIDSLVIPLEIQLKNKDVMEFDYV